MKQATIHKHVLILVILAVLAIAGCKSGSSWKMENPFSRKPKAPSKETPKEIDGIQLSAPPEKYSKELSKNESDKAKAKEKSSAKTFAQKGKYETFPSSQEMKIDRAPEVAVTPGSPGSAMASIPAYKSEASASASATGTKVASTASGSPIDKSSPWPSTQATSPGSAYPTTQQAYPGTSTNTGANTSPMPAAGTYPTTQQTYPGTSTNQTSATGTYPTTQQTYPGTSTNPMPATGTYPTTQQTYPGTSQGTSTVPAATSSTSAGTMAPGFAPGSIGGN
ncbi:MAG: hypothetical protein PHQ75_06990 [Thermoguttaceae bacterium]|nr:hypothetical protein [Thermoguttaceae bacterium]